MRDTASSKPAVIILKNTINALSACLSVLTSLVGFIFIVSFIGCIVYVIGSPVISSTQKARIPKNASCLI